MNFDWQSFLANKKVLIVGGVVAVIVLFALFGGVGGEFPDWTVPPFTD
jgi:hypothetical protein